MITEKPWGKEELLKKDEDTWVKILTINPEQRISLQKHADRTEVWTIISGTGIVDLDADQYLVKKHDTIVVPQTIVHRIHNYSKVSLLVICEVATGSPQDSDITRLADDYARK